MTTVLSEAGVSQVIGLSNVSVGLINHTSSGSDTHNEQEIRTRRTMKKILRKDFVALAADVFI